MKRLLAIALLALVTACAKPDASVIDQVQNAVTNACGFLPTASTILAILGLHDSALGTAEEIARAICSSLDQAQKTRTAPTLKGVAIEGRKIRP